MKNDKTLTYESSTISILKELIPDSQKYYSDKITQYVLPIYASSKEIYISYFVKVPYIDHIDIPIAEDIHINYEIRYIRECKWFTIDDIINLEETDFHKRLQITRISQVLKVTMIRSCLHNIYVG